jgi:hypothetical protein
MAANKAAETETPDPETVKFDAAKAAFEEAARKTKAAEGVVPAAVRVKPDPKAKKVEAEPEPEAEAPAPVKKPKVAAKPKPESQETVLAAKLDALQAKLDALSARQTEPEDDDAEDPMDGIRGKLVERFGEDEAGALVEALEALHAPAAKRLAHLEGILKQATESGRKAISKSNQKRLAAIYPQLARKEAWDILNSQVLQAFERDNKAFESADEAYDSLAATLYGEPEVEEPPEAVEEEPPEETELAASRIAAAAMTPPARAARKEPRSRLDKAKEIFNHLKKHPEDKAGAKRLARELRADR